MKFLASLLLIIALGYMAGLFMAWWSVALVAFLVALLIPLSSGKAFACGFIAIFILWMAVAFFQDVRNDHILANRVSEIFLKMHSPVLMGIISSVIGALVAGMGSLTGSLLRKTLNAKGSTLNA
ncbi:hypothetical protein [Chitinophaga japonensis]|uniref:Uncharacterized protein n=1 Tax=Chitinophaga japonensis TaxID=104662 RepID=A0A562SYX8_CHIJA|nr:hypothetical protein [Chitinophaga japonensis]TWI86234.1 hypothetical protein LX66_3486 [Chitinophaga japonensis]